MSLENSFGAKEENMKTSEENCNVSFENNPNAENSEETNNLKKHYLCLLLKTTFNSLDKIFMKSLLIHKFNCFNLVKEYQISKSLNKLKGCIISNKIKNSLIKLLGYNREFVMRSIHRCLSKWWERTKINIKMSKYRAELEQSALKKIEKETKVQDQKLKEREKENQEIKKLISKNLELSTDLTKKIKDYEEKESKNNILLKKLEEEKRILQEDLKINEKVYRNSESIEKMENKIKEYDSQVKILQTQINEKEYNISLFVKEMNDMLEAYEKINAEVLNHNKDIDLEGTSKSTKPTIRTMNSQISNNNNNSSSINNIVNANNPSQHGLNTMRTSTNNNTSTSKGIFLNVYNSNQNSTKLSFNMNKNNLSNNSNIFKSKN